MCFALLLPIHSGPTRTNSKALKSGVLGRLVTISRYARISSIQARVFPSLLYVNQRATELVRYTGPPAYCDAFVKIPPAPGTHSTLTITHDRSALITASALSNAAL